MMKDFLNFSMSVELIQRDQKRKQRTVKNRFLTVPFQNKNKLACVVDTSNTSKAVGIWQNMVVYWLFKVQKRFD